MKITIYVTRRDIRHGTQRNCHSCPVALAITRRLSPAFTASVRNTAVRIGPVMKWLPQEARRFIARFDDGKRVRPIRFRVDIGRLYLR